MAKTNKQRVLDYLWSVGPQGATNSDIRAATDIQSHQQVYMLTQELRAEGAIRGVQRGREWFFYADDDRIGAAPTPSRKLAPCTASGLSASQFEILARDVMSRHYSVPLRERQVAGIPKRFDFVSDDETIMGDAKYFSLVGGQRLPPAKFSVIAEHVWLLEKSKATRRFLVFGNDREVPHRWLHRYGDLAPSVTFFFLSDAGELERLLPPDPEAR